MVAAAVYVEKRYSILLCKKQLLVKFSFWLIGPNSDSTGYLEVYKHEERFNTLDKCWKEMITKYRVVVQCML